MHSIFILIVWFFSFGSVTEKLQQTFHEVFPNANKVTWTETKGIHAVYFFSDNIRSVMYFDESGDFMESTRYYSGDRLLLSVRWRLINKFHGMHITGVTETTSSNVVSYTINLENEKEIVTVRTDERGNYIIKEKLNKSDFH